MRKPRAIFHLMQAKCSQVTSGAEYSVALSRDANEVYSWGWYARHPQLFPQMSQATKGCPTDIWQAMLEA